MRATHSSNMICAMCSRLKQYSANLGARVLSVRHSVTSQSARRLGESGEIWPHLIVGIYTSPTLARTVLVGKLDLLVLNLNFFELCISRSNSLFYFFIIEIWLMIHNRLLLELHRGRVRIPNRCDEHHTQHPRNVGPPTHTSVLLTAGRVGVSSRFTGITALQ